MRMGKLPVSKIVFFLLVLTCSSFADTVYLKNGRQISGVITRENSDSVELAVKLGTLKLYSSQIDRIVRSDSGAAKAMVDSWDKERREAAEKKEQEKQSEPEKQKDASQESGSIQARLEPEAGAAKSGSSAAIKGERLGNHLVVTALLNGKVKARLIVDTGATAVLLSLEKANELKGVHIRKYDMPDFMGTVADGRSVGSVSFKLDSLDLGGMEAEDVDAHVVLKGQKIGEGIDGLLGMSYLQNFKFQLDLPNNQLILQRLGKKQDKI